MRSCSIVSCTKSTLGDQVSGRVLSGITSGPPCYLTNEEEELVMFLCKVAQIGQGCTPLFYEKELVIFIIIVHGRSHSTVYMCDYLLETGTIATRTFPERYSKKNSSHEIALLEANGNNASPEMLHQRIIWKAPMANSLLSV